MNITTIIVALTALISFAAFSNHKLLNGLIFYPYRIWRNNEWHRLISCGFIHGDLGHLLFNMIALFSFGIYVEGSFQAIFDAKGRVLYVLMYFVAIAIADIYNLFKKREDPEYRSLGASGGVSAVVFASILLNPFSKIYMFFIPIGIPAYIFGGLYLLYCAYMAKRGGGGIAHMAHFTGSVFGFIFPLLFRPSLFTDFLQLLLNGRQP